MLQDADFARGRPTGLEVNRVVAHLDCSPDLSGCARLVEKCHQRGPGVSAPWAGAQKKLDQRGEIAERVPMAPENLRQTSLPDGEGDPQVSRSRRYLARRAHGPPSYRATRFVR